MFCDSDIERERQSFKPAPESLSFLRKYVDISVIAKANFFQLQGFC